MTAKQYAALFGLLATWPMSCACTSAQLTTIEAKAKACSERPDVRKCQAEALADCVIEGKECDEKATVKASIECLAVCKAPQDGEGGAAGDGG